MVNVPAAQPGPVSILVSASGSVELVHALEHSQVMPSTIICLDRSTRSKASMHCYSDALSLKPSNSGRVNAIKRT